MVYLSVDGKELGAMNSSLEYVQVWSNGIASQYDEPNIFRCEDNGEGLISVSKPSISVNNVSVRGGSYEDGVYSDAQLQLDQEIVLLHNRPWNVEWQSTGAWKNGAMLFASHYQSRNADATYFYRKTDCSIFALGQVVDGAYQSQKQGFADFPNCHRQHRQEVRWGIISRGDAPAERLFSIWHLQ